MTKGHHKRPCEKPDTDNLGYEAARLTFAAVSGAAPPPPIWPAA